MATVDEGVRKVLVGLADRLIPAEGDMPAGGGVTPKTASFVLAEARWCDHGQTPQMLVTIRGSSSTGLPMQNFSKPRSSTTLTKVSATLPSSSRLMVTFAWPSSLVTG